VTGATQELRIFTGSANAAVDAASAARPGRSKIMTRMDFLRKIGFVGRFWP